MESVLATLSVMDEEREKNGGVIPLPEPQEERKAAEKKKKLWNIRPKGDPDFPIPDCCSTECYDCRKAHYMYIHEHALNDEYKRLLENEKYATTNTISAVEALEKEQAEKLSDVSVELDIEKSKTLKLTAELEVERKLRLSEVYTRQSESNVSNAVAAGF